MVTFEKALLMCLAFGLGNFIWQAFTEQNWVDAAERTYSQCVAVLICWFFWRGS